MFLLGTVELLLVDEVHLLNEVRDRRITPFCHDNRISLTGSRSDTGDRCVQNENPHEGVCSR